jgi:dihydroxyacid dehydratase/phosphogluconate dehydratase
MALNRRSRNITQGVQRAPNRSMYYGMGYESADFDKPMVGVANAHSTITPCNAGLQRWPTRRSRGCARRVPIRRSSARRRYPTACPWARRG